MLNKILYLCDLGSDNRTGGGQTFAINFLKILAEIKTIDLKVVSILNRNDIVTDNFLKKNEINTEIDFFRKKTSFNFFDFFDLNNYIDKRYNEITFFILSDITFYIRNINSRNIIGMFHGDVSYKDKSFKFTHLRHPRTFLNSFFWKETIVTNFIRINIIKKTPLFNSFDTYNKLLKSFFEIDVSRNKNNITWLPLDTNYFKPNLAQREKYRSKYNIKHDDIVITYITNFTAEKKQANLIPEYLKEFVDCKNIKILFVGRGGPLSTELENFSSNHANIIRIPECDYYETACYFNMSDILFSLSNDESFGYTVAEGMSCGKPTVLFRNSALLEYTENNVNCLACTDKDTFVKAVYKLIKSKALREKLGKNARSTVLNRFSFLQFKNRFLEIMNNV